MKAKCLKRISFIVLLAMVSITMTGCDAGSVFTVIKNVWEKITAIFSGAKKVVDGINTVKQGVDILRGKQSPDLKDIAKPSNNTGKEDTRDGISDGAERKLREAQASQSYPIIIIRDGLSDGAEQKLRDGISDAAEQKLRGTQATQSYPNPKIIIRDGLSDGAEQKLRDGISDAAEKKLRETQSPKSNKSSPKKRSLTPDEEGNIKGSK